MQRSKKINQIDNKNRYLIDYANLKNGLIKHQNNFLNKKNFKLFCKNPYLGFPLILPAKLNYFDYPKNKKSFNLDFKKVKKKIFNVKNKKYKPLNNFFNYGNIFCEHAKPKKKYLKIAADIKRENLMLKKMIMKLKKKNKIIGAFQTRNIPHLGHEKILNLLLRFCDMVIVNPVIGPKKEGDVKPTILKKVYDFLIKKHYKNKILYRPVYANMHYAGPREAIHHALIREKLGFDYFIVGRDHAGAENAYNFSSAANIIKKYKKKLAIEVVTHKGSFFCKTCKKIVIKGECKETKCDLRNISGTEFRNCIKNGKTFNYARQDLQIFLKKIKENLFY